MNFYEIVEGACLMTTNVSLDFGDDENQDLGIFSLSLGLYWCPACIHWN